MHARLERGTDGLHTPARHLLLTARGLWPWCVPWGVPLARYKGGRGACLGGVRVREGWPRRVLSGPRAYLHTG